MRETGSSLARNLKNLMLSPSLILLA